ncbi:MAG: alpha/beta hydrolase fold domain-containing protein [Thermoanaerobaculia bacterium]
MTWPSTWLRSRGVLYSLTLLLAIPALTVVFAAAAFANDPPAAEAPGVLVDRDVIYATRGDSRLRLDLYSPAGAPGPFGVAVLLHGERPLDRDRSFWRPLAEQLAARGYVAAAVEYRTLRTARHPAAVEDVRAAIQWLRDNARERRIRPDRMMLVGENFGGYLAALVALRDEPEPLRIQGVVAIHAPFDLASHRPFGSYPYAHALYLGYPEKERPDLWRAASPLTHIHAGAPPFLLLHGTDDEYTSFEQSAAAHAALTREGVQAEIVPFPGRGNGLLEDQQSRERVLQRIRRFADATLWVPPAEVVASRDIVYASPGGRELRLDLYHPRRKEGQAPGIIFLHGGGWLWGSHRDMRDLAARVAARGFVTATVEYRLAQERIYPAAVDDAKAAVRWMRANADRLGIDGNAIGISGISAGGHLAALVAVTGDRSYFVEADRYRDVSAAVQAAAPIAGVVDMPAQDRRDPYSPAIFLGSTPNERPELWRDASPTNHVTRSAPPFLFLHGTEDELVAIGEAEEMASRLRAAGVAAEVYAAKGGDHDFIHHQPWREPAVERLIAFFESVLGERE